MYVQNSRMASVSSTLTASGKAGSSGFEKIFESNLAKISQEKAELSYSSFSPGQALFKDNKLLQLGIISSAQPTVSHLLVNHPEYGGNCWEIIHSDLNKDKAYTRIPDGTTIYIDPESKEISWDRTPVNQPVEGARGFPRGMVQEFLKGSLPEESYRTNHLLNNAADGLRSSNKISRRNENQLINRYVSRAATKYDLPEELIRGVIKAESDFQVHAVSPAGAQGLMQLMPGTARDLGVKNPFDIKENIDAGVRYLKKMLNTFNGDLKKALAAYNAGPQTVKNYQGNVPYQETKRYVQKVLSFLSHYE